MSDTQIFAVLNLPSVSISPSATGLQFSGDGQAFLLAKHAVYILTPDIGVNVELSSVMKQALDSDVQLQSVQSLGWLRTVVEFDRGLTHQWPIDCQDWGSVCLGSLDPSLRALALSPSNLTSTAGCLFVLLNSNLELSLWGASKNFLTGGWKKFQDITSALKDAAETNSSSVLLRTLQAQTTCIEWSPQPDLCLTPAPAIDASLLAVGNRAGSVSFLRYDEPTERMIILDQVALADKWICHLAWSGWTRCQNGMCEAILGCAAADGAVIVLKVQRSLAARPMTSELSSEYDFGLKFPELYGIVSEADGRAVTAMKWANTQGRNPILIFHKAGAVYLWSAQSPQCAWSDRKVLTLRTQKRSVGSSALCPASGICYIQSRDISVISLSDGSFHVVHRVSADPTLDPPSSETLSSSALSAASRSIFLRVEAEKMTPKDVDRINSATTFGDNSTMIWTYECVARMDAGSADVLKSLLVFRASRPMDFSYKHDAKHVSTLVVAQLWDENLDERVIEELAERVGHAKSATGQAPIDRLRPILLHLRDSQRLARLHGRILDVLQHEPFRESPVPKIALPSLSCDIGTDLPSDFANSLTTHLFGWDGILSERMRYAVAEFCQKASPAPDVQLQFADASRRFVNSVRAHVLLTLLRHMISVKTCLNVDDMFFARRLLALASTASDVPELAKEAGELFAHLAVETDSEARPNVADHLDEVCPACHAPVPLQDAETAVCPNGHVWVRCCVTFFILATPLVRTCVGCSRKAFLPASAERTPENDSGWLPSPASSSRVLRHLLNATRRCPFCENNFVVLV